MKPDLKTIIKDNFATFSHYRQDVLYFHIKVDGKTYSFPVPTDDLGDATVNIEEKAIMLMRYIRKALADGTFVEVKE